MCFFDSLNYKSPGNDTRLNVNTQTHNLYSIHKYMLHGYSTLYHVPGVIWLRALVFGVYNILTRWPIWNVSHSSIRSYFSLSVNSNLNTFPEPTSNKQYVMGKSPYTVQCAIPFTLCNLDFYFKRPLFWQHVNLPWGPHTIENN